MLVDPVTTVELKSIRIFGDVLQPLLVVLLTCQISLSFEGLQPHPLSSCYTQHQFVDDGPAAVELFSVRHLSQGPDELR